MGGDGGGGGPSDGQQAVARNKQRRQSLLNVPVLNVKESSAAVRSLTNMMTLTERAAELGMTELVGLEEATVKHAIRSTRHLRHNATWKR